MKKEPKQTEKDIKLVNNKCSVLPRGQNFGRKTQKGQTNCMGFNSGFTPFYITNAGGEPLVKVGVWRLEMWGLTTGQSPAPHAVINTVYRYVIQ
jgi:hypothetical protein